MNNLEQVRENRSEPLSLDSFYKENSNPTHPQAGQPANRRRMSFKSGTYGSPEETYE